MKRSKTNEISIIKIIRKVSFFFIHKSRNKRRDYRRVDIVNEFEYSWTMYQHILNKILMGKR